MISVSKREFSRWTYVLVHFVLHHLGLLVERQVLQALLQRMSSEAVRAVKLRHEARNMAWELVVYVRSLRLTRIVRTLNHGGLNQWIEQYI